MREHVDRYLVNAGAEGDALHADLSRLYDATTVLIEGQLLNIVTLDFEGEYRRYEEAGEIYPGNPAIERLKALTLSKVFALRAGELARQGKPDEAIAMYERAISVNPDPADETVGHSHFRIG